MERVEFATHRICRSWHLDQMVIVVRLWWLLLLLVSRVWVWMRKWW